MNVHLEELKKDYQAENLVPFIGAGLSVPFKVPSWKDLIINLTEKYLNGKPGFMKEAVLFELDNGDYWGAIDSLEKYGILEDEDIQEGIKELIQERKINLDNDLEHNYSDLTKMSFSLYLTTNYEKILEEYLDSDIQSILLKDIDFNTQNLFDDKRVCYLHGTIGNTGTIVISRKSYKTLYGLEKYNDLLRVITGNKKLLFLGFSFDDQFVKTLIKDHRNTFKNNHYILLNKPSDDQIRELRSTYGLKTIPYDTTNSTHTLEIRKILEYISKENEKEKKNSDFEEQHIVIGAGLTDFQNNLEENLFYKKLELENIEDDLIELSSCFYVAADKYIIDMKKQGMPLKVINSILGKVFLEYKEKYRTIYKKEQSSEVFIEAVHESLENIDLERFRPFLKNNESDKHENRGFIHILADSEKNDVWWGGKRFDGTEN